MTQQATWGSRVVDVITQSPNIEKKKESRSIWQTTGCHMWLRFCHLRLWNSLWSICECFANPNLHFCLKIEAFLSRAAKIKDKEVQTGTAMEIRTKRGTSFCLRLHLSRGSAHYATLFKTYSVILYIFSFLMLYHSILLAFLLSISLKCLAKCKLKWKY